MLAVVLTGEDDDVSGLGNIRGVLRRGLESSVRAFVFILFGTSGIAYCTGSFLAGLRKNSVEGSPLSE